MNNTFPIRTANLRSIVSYIPADRDAALADRIVVAATESGASLFHTTDLAKTLGRLGSHSCEPVLAAFSDFGPEAVSFLESVHALSSDAPVIIILEQHSVSHATQFMRHGVFECLGPLPTIKELSTAFQAAFDRIAENGKMVSSPHAEPWRRQLIGQSPAHERVAKVIRLIAPRRCTVLITGETGTGKEVVAKAIHMASDRSRRPMISVNCSALPENLIEAELFGHNKGAFTGATESRIGRFQQADGGTLFLDEIGDLPYDLQAKLLRVLQEREIQKLGGGAPIKVDVRLIAATNANLLAKVQQGTFREDMYYRLNVVPVHLPSLREKTGDIPLLVEHFVQKVCAAEKLSGKLVTPTAMSRLCAYTWPGNVRQLENIVEQAVVMNADEQSLDIGDFVIPRTDQPERVVPIGSSHDLAGTTLPAEGMDLAQALRQFERAILDQALTRTRGNKTLAADMLRIPRTTLIHKLRALELAA